jgi:glycerol-3-phosphate dehydrogenase
LSYQQALRLVARYGISVLDFAAALPREQIGTLPGLPIHWLEFTWAARHEAVCHLDDLLLRRVRLGLLAREGGAAYLPHIRALVQAELGWNDTRWEQEEADYRTLWQSHYSVPERVAETEPEMG